MHKLKMMPLLFFEADGVSYSTPPVEEAEEEAEEEARTDEVNTDEVKTEEPSVEEVEAEPTEREGETEETSEEDEGEEEPEKPKEENLEESEVEKLKRELREEIKAGELKAIGLSEEYLPLIQGNDKEEIKASSSLLKKLVDDTRAKTEASVKKQYVKTITPGSGTPSTKLSDEEFYRSILENK